MTTDTSGLAERMQGDPKLSDATLDELIEVFGTEGVQGMFNARALTDLQGREWQARLPTPPPFGEPVPPSV